MQPRVVYDHKHLVIIYKPCGISFHTTTDNRPGIMHVIRSTLPTTSSGTSRLYPVHRLDADTSGLLMVAKTPQAANELIQQFRAKQVQKYYVGISERKPSKKMGTVAGAQKKGRRGSWLLEREPGPSPAVTRFISTGLEINADHPDSAAATERYRAFLLKPETGKTHQLRVAMKSLGSPVLGDVRYSAKEDAKLQDRMYLHCCALRCRLFNEEIIQVVNPPIEGRIFTAPEFRKTFDDWFPSSYLDADEWFSDNKLLRSLV